MAAQSVRVLIANWVLLGAGLVNIVIGTLQATAGNVALAGTCLTAGLVLLLAGTIERFESLKGLGLEAKTRKLEDKLEQADAVLEKLRGLTETVCPVLVTMNARAGRFASAPSPEETYEFSRKVRRLLLATGSSEATIRLALTPWAQMLAFDVTKYILDDAVLKISTAHGLPATARLTQARNEGVDDRFRWQLDRFPIWLAELGAKDLQLPEAETAWFKGEVTKWVSELEYLRDNLDLKDKVAWFKQAAHTRTQE